MLTTIN